MYEDLVKSLRSCWRINDPSFNCVQMKNGACDPVGCCVPYLHDMAADAIEDLQERIANIMVTVKRQEHIIKANTAADVRPVVLGKWIEHYEPYSTGEEMLEAQYGYECSICGRWEYEKEPFCNCGAMMEANDEKA